MQAKPPQASLVRTILGYIAIAVFAIGCLTVLRYSIRLAASLNYHQLESLFSWFQDTVGDHLDGWLTGISTAILAWLTYVLTKSTREQGARNAPLIRFILSEEDPNRAGTLPYVDTWQKDDQSDRNLAGFLVAGPRYIWLDVTNQQSKPYGLAFDVSITLVLEWGANDNATAHPHTIRRVAMLTVLGASEADGGPVFNVGALPNYVINVVDVSYTDIGEQRRSAAYGLGNLWKELGGGPPVPSEVVFKPTKKESGR